MTGSSWAGSGPGSPPKLVNKIRLRVAQRLPAPSLWGTRLASVLLRLVTGEEGEGLRLPGDVGPHWPRRPAQLGFPAKAQALPFGPSEPPSAGVTVSLNPMEPPS